MEDSQFLIEDRSKGYEYCCGAGTHENHICWINLMDRTGLICSWTVILFLGYSAAVVAIGLYLGYLDDINGVILLILCGMSILSHFKTMFSDPGAIPRNAHPLPEDISAATVSVCGRCDAYKPPGSHHDRVSNRCVSRMDHFCKSRIDCNDIKPL